MMDYCISIAAVSKVTRLKSSSVTSPRLQSILDTIAHWKAAKRDPGIRAHTAFKSLQFKTKG